MKKGLTLIEYIESFVTVNLKDADIDPEIEAAINLFSDRVFDKNLKEFHERNTNKTQAYSLWRGTFPKAGCSCWQVLIVLHRLFAPDPATEGGCA